MRDIKNNVDLVKSINPAAYTTAQTGAGVDLSGYGSAMAILSSGALTDGTHTPKLQESNDDSTYTDVGTDDLEGTFAALSANSVARVGYKGAMRYIRVYVTSSGSTGCIYGASIARGNPAVRPIA